MMSVVEVDVLLHVSDIHRLFQQEVGLNHVHFWKSVYIRAILKYTGKIPM